MSRYAMCPNCGHRMSRDLDMWGNWDGETYRCDYIVVIGALPNAMMTMMKHSTFIRLPKYGLQTEKMRTICSDTQKMSWKRHYNSDHKNMARPQSNHRICSLAVFSFQNAPTFALCRVIFFLG